MTAHVGSVDVGPIHVGPTIGPMGHGDMVPTIGQYRGPMGPAEPIICGIHRFFRKSTNIV